MTHDIPPKSGKSLKIIENPVEKSENMSGTDCRFIPYSTTNGKINGWKGID